MSRRFRTRIVSSALVILGQFAGGALTRETAVQAQHLSIRHYDVSDGLAHSHVSALHQDAKGYLWLATWEGLSRFDGYRFAGYNREREHLGDFQL